MTQTRSLFVQWGEQGLLQHAVPCMAGGHGDTFLELIVAHRARGYSMPDTGQLLALNAHIWGSLFPILRQGTAWQHEVWLDGLVSGRLVGGHAITEPQAGSDLQGLVAAAVREGENFRLNGRKRWITNTPDADLLIVYVQMPEGLSAFVVQSDDPGADFRSSPAVEACEAAGMGDLVLEDCLLPSQRLLGLPGNGLLLAQQALELERAFIFAGVCGLMQAQLETVIKACRRRKIGERPLIRNAAIAHRIADMRTRLDTVWLWVKQCAELADAGRGITLASSQTKLLGAEAFLQSSLDSVQLLGAAGLESGATGNAWVRDAMASRLFSGSSEVQKNIIAGMLGAGGD